MTETDETQYRTYHQPDPADISLRENDDDGLFTVRMPVVTTGEVRNEGDEAFDRSAIEGMAEQIENDSIGVFLDHGWNSDLAGSRFSATEKVGEWRNPDVEDRSDGESHVVADAVLMDPETLPDETTRLREALSTIKAQVERDFALSSSISWREDDTAPGGNDLVETSIVGIPADPRTTSHDGPVAMARAILAESELSDGDRERLVEKFGAAVMGSDSDGIETDTHDMTDESNESESAEADGEADADTDDTDSRDESDSVDANEYRETMLELQRAQTETLNTLAEAIRQDDDEDDDDDDDDDDDEGDDEQADDDEDDEDRSVEDDVAELRGAYDTLREGGVDVDDLELPEAESDEDRDADDEEGTDTEPTFSFSDMEA